MSTKLPLPIRQAPYRRIGGWMPENNNVVVDWLRDLLKEIEEDKKKYRGPWELSKEVKELKEVIEKSAEIRMLAQAMLDEVPDKPPYCDDPIGNKQIKCLDDLYLCFDKVMRSKAPIWKKSYYDVGLVGFPFNAVLDWPMATPSGYAFFLKPEINEKLGAILDTWKTKFLETSASRSVLAHHKEDDVPWEEAWLSQESRQQIEKDTNREGEDYKFEQLFECYPDQDYYGFKSWDDFFIRRFKDYDTIRPIAFEENDDWIINSCESKPFSLQAKAKDYDKFWIKGQPYSIMDMLKNNEEYAAEFVGGTVYQAFLSATSYHRWDSPINGRVVRTEIIEGTYFAAPTVTGFLSANGPDPASPDLAQGYITHFATRAVFYIKNERIGLIALLYVGMADVSSCEIAAEFDDKNLPTEGAPVRKGQELGMFHHGGSTYCLLLPKGTKAAFVPEATPREEHKNIPIRSALARVYNDDFKDEPEN